MTEIPKGHGAWHGGKGSAPKDSDQKKYADNYDAIFGKKEKKEVEPTPVKDNKPALPNGLEKHWKK